MTVEKAFIASLFLYQDKIIFPNIYTFNISIIGFVFVSELAGHNSQKSDWYISRNTPTINLGRDGAYLPLKARGEIAQRRREGSLDICRVLGT